MSVNQELVDNVTTLIQRNIGLGHCGCRSKIGSVLATLSQFQIREWIPCTDRMPDCKSVYFIDENKRIVAGWFYVDCGCPWKSREDDESFIGWHREAITHWMPRHIPAPPKEDSPQVKELKVAKTIMKPYMVSLEKAIEIAKKYEVKK